MKQKTLIACLVLLMALPAIARRSSDGHDHSRPRAAATIDFGTYINANKMLMFATNKASFAYDNGVLFGKADGLYFPHTSIADIEDGSNTLSVIYAGSVWMGAVDSASGDTLVTSGQHDTDWGIGPLDSIGSPPIDPVSNLTYRVYKLYKDSLADNPNTDYLEWPVAMGAPVEDDGSGNMVPAILGDQFLWSVTNDNDPTYHIGNAGTVGEGLGIEMRQSTFAWNRVGPLANIVFMKMAFYNKGGKTLENMFISVWSDPDLGDASDDLVGCDTTLGLGYCYNAGANDGSYGSKPPAVGYDFFQGPMDFTGVDTDTAIMWGQKWPGYLNQGLSSFNKYVNPNGPDVPLESYRFMNGLFKDGSDLLDHNGNVTKFFGYGDPVAGTGFLDASGADRRFMQSVGPFTMRPGDSTEIIVAVVAAQGEDYLNSITQMKGIDAFAQKVYEDNFQVPDPPTAPEVTAVELDAEIGLFWGTISEEEPGGYPFEGYAVFQGESMLGPWDTLAWYDLVNGVTSVWDFASDPNLDPHATIVTVKPGLDNGLSYVHHATIDVTTGLALSNYTDYFFKVEAYSVDTTQPVMVKTLTSQTIVQVNPHMPIAGTTIPFEYDDLPDVAHTGPSDGVVSPIVVDPYALTGHDYSVTFGQYPDSTIGFVDWITVDTTVVTLTDTCWFEHVWDDGISDSVWQMVLCDDTTITSTTDSTTWDTAVVIIDYWDLNDLTLNTVLLSRVLNQTGNGNYQVVDGFHLKVEGPPQKGKDWEYIAADPPNISPVMADDQPAYAGNNRWFSGDPGNGGELLFGSVFMEPNFWGSTSVAAGNEKTVEIRYRPMESYTDLDGNGAYTPGEPYVVDDPSLTQKAFMYTSFSGATWEGFYSVPFTAWDVTDAANPRQLNVVMRDRDADSAWNLHSQVPDASLPNGGDQRYNYTWIVDSDYDPTGTKYGDGTGGTVDFWSYDGGSGVWDALWTLWQYPRGTTRGQLAEECILRLTPNIINTPADVFTFTMDAATVLAEGPENVLDNVKAVPNPYYLFSSYDNSTYNKRMKFTNLPSECTINIFTLGGDQVRRLWKNDDMTYIEWDLLNEASIPLASGIYIYVVDSPGFGHKIGKMAIFTEKEVLDQF